MKRILFAIAVMECAANPALARQGANLSITAMDPQRAVISSARVAIYLEGEPSPRIGNTDERGRFSVDAPANATLIVVVAADGFRKTSRTVVTKPGRDHHEEFVLEIGGVDSAVVVTAADAPQTVDQITKALTVVGAEEIRNRGETTLTGILNTIPGVQIHNVGGPGQLSTMRVRGLRSDSAAVLIDGLRFRDAATAQGDASSFLSNLNLVAPDRIEMLRGSGSSLYGTNAASGVVNIVTDPGGGRTRGTIEAAGGNLGVFRGRTQIAGGALNNRLKYTAGLLHLNVMRGVDGNDRARSTGTAAFLRYDVNPATNLSARFFGSDDFAQNNITPTVSGIPTANIIAGVTIPALPLSSDQVRRLLSGQSVNYGPATYVPGLDDPDSRRASRLSTTALKFHHLISPALNVQGSYQRVHTNRIYVNGPAGRGFQPVVANDSRYAGNIDTIDARANIRVAPENQWSVGYEFERETYADLLDNKLTGAQQVRNQTDIQQNSHAFYFQNQSSFIGKRLQLSVSGRVQAFALNRPSFQAAGVVNNYDRIQLPSPPAALTGDVSFSYFTAATGTKIRAHLGNAYRAPSLFERFGGGFFTDPSTGQLVFTPYGDPRLAPDRYNSIDGGIDQYFWRSRVRVSSTYFYTRVVTITAFDSGAVVRLATDPYGRSSGYINGSGGLSRGLELSAEARPAASLTISGSYTYTRANMDRDITVPGFWRVLGVPRHSVTLVAAGRLARRATVGVDLFGVSEEFGNFTAAGRPRAYTYPGFTRTNVSASYALTQADRGGVKVTARIENIFNRRYYDLGWLAPQTTFLTGLAYQF